MRWDDDADPQLAERVAGPWARACPDRCDHAPGAVPRSDRADVLRDLQRTAADPQPVHGQFLLPRTATGGSGVCLDPARAGTVGVRHGTALVVEAETAETKAARAASLGAP